MATLIRPNEMIVGRAGTLAFMAPEVMLEQPFDFKADIWSLGVILYTLIASKLPHDDHLYHPQYENHLLSEPMNFTGKPFDSVSSECLQLLQSMLEKDQLKRPKIEEVLQHPWIARK